MERRDTARARGSITRSGEECKATFGMQDACRTALPLTSKHDGISHYRRPYPGQWLLHTLQERWSELGPDWFHGGQPFTSLSCEFARPL